MKPREVEPPLGATAKKCVNVCVVVVVEIITLYQVQTGRFLATTGYVAPSPNHVQNNVQKEIRV